MIDLVLDNGLRITALKKSTLKSSSITALVDYGTAYESENESAHLLEHALLSNISEGLLKNGSYAHGKTFPTYTTYYLPFYYKYADETADLITKLMLHPSFNEENINNDKRSVLLELSRVHDNPFIAFNDKMIVVLFGDKIKKSIPEEINITESTNTDMLEDTYYKHYTPSKTHIFAYGAINEEKIVERLKNNFRHAGDGTTDKNRNQPTIKKSPEQEVKYNFDSALVGTGFTLPGTEHFGKNMYSYYSFSMAFQGLITRLNDALKNKGLIYEGQSQEQVFNSAGYCWYFAPVDKKNTEEAQKTISTEIDSISKSGFSNDEFGFYKKRMLLNYTDNKENKERFSIDFLRFKLAYNLEDNEIETNPIEDLRKDNLDEAVSNYLSRRNDLVINNK